MLQKCWSAEVTLRLRTRQVRTLYVYARTLKGAANRMLAGKIRVREGAVERTVRVRDFVTHREIERKITPADPPNGKVLIDVAPARESRS